MENKKQFLKELHDLLEKYDVEIDIELDGDTHGVSSDLIISHKLPPIGHRQMSKYEELFRTSGSIDKYELENL